MKKAMKKALVLLLAAMMLLSVTGCGSKKEEEAPAPSTDSQQTETQAPAEETKELDYPTKPITVIVPVKAGSTVDLTTRILTDALSKKVGQQVKIENIAGGNLNLGIGDFCTREADGYTLLTAGTAIYSNPSLYEKLDWSPEDLQPLSWVGTTTYYFFVNNDFPAQTFEEMMEYCKANPGKVKAATGGIGGQYLQFLQLEKAYDIDLDLVNYGSNADAVLAVAGGEADITQVNYTSGSSFVDDGTMRCLAVAKAERDDVYGDIPTVTECGYPELTFETGIGLFARAGTDEAILDYLEKAVDEVRHDPAVVEMLMNSGYDLPYGTREDYTNDYYAYVERFKELVEMSGLEKISA